MKRFTKREGQKGFTLIELLIVIIIIGILAAIAIPMFLSQRNKAKDAGVKEGIHSIQIGVQSYAVDNTTYPQPAAGIVAALSPGYVDIWPNNQFSGNPMIYSAGASEGDFAYTVTAVTFDNYTLTGWMSNSKTFVIASN
jgi:type II secretion system protein G